MDLVPVAGLSLLQRCGGNIDCRDLRPVLS